MNQQKLEHCMTQCLSLAQQSQNQTLDFLFTATNWVRALHQLIHGMQLERGATVMTMAFAESSTVQSQLQHYRSEFEKSTAHFVEITSHIDQITSVIASHSIYLRLANLFRLIDDIQQLRELIDTGAISVEKAALQFTHIIDEMLAFIFELAEYSTDPEITRSMLALFNFMQAKEFNGQERALGVLILSQSTHDLMIHHRFEKIVDEQNAYMEAFLLFAEENERQALENINQSEITQTIQAWRSKLLNEPTKDLDLATGWFELLTEKMDGLQVIEDTLISLLQIISAKRRATNTVAPIKSPALSMDLKIDQTGFNKTLASVAGISHLLIQEYRSQSTQLNQAKAELITAKQSVLDRQSIEQAKSLLMQKHQWSEDEAHRFIRTQAMNTNVKMIDYAKRFLAEQ